MDQLPQLPPLLAPLAALVGRWEGHGTGTYPTIEDFGYTEEIEILPVPGKPLLSHRTATKATDDGRALHTEAGFWRVVPDRDPVVVELVLATGSGLIEASTGPVVADAADGEAVVVALNSTVVAGTPSAKSVTATARRYRVSGDTLTYDVDMAAVGQPLHPHLHATLTRHGH